MGLLEGYGDGMITLIKEESVSHLRSIQEKTLQTREATLVWTLYLVAG